MGTIAGTRVLCTQYPARVAKDDVRAIMGEGRGEIETARAMSGPR